MNSRKEEKTLHWINAAGYQLPLRWYPARQARANLVLMGALGMAARYYESLARALCAQGFNVVLAEQRGHGDSPLRASRSVDFGFREALDEEIPALMDWLEARAPGRPLYLMGHSLGGHYAAMTAGRFPRRVQGVIIAACSSPWPEAFPQPERRRIRLLCFLLPVLLRLYGYYPGDRMGFGGREARTLMRDWLVLARENRYRALGLDEDLEAGIRRYPGHLLSLRMAEDTYAPEAAMAAVSDKFAAARVTRQVLTTEMLGERADHFRWARAPDAVARAVASWSAGIEGGDESPNCVAGKMEKGE